MDDPTCILCGRDLVFLQIPDFPEGVDAGVCLHCPDGLSRYDEELRRVAELLFDPPPEEEEP